MAPRDRLRRRGRHQAVRRPRAAGRPRPRRRPRPGGDRRDRRISRDWDAEETHKWVEGMWRRTDDLTLAGPRAFRAHVGRDRLADARALRRVRRYGPRPCASARTWSSGTGWPRPAECSSPSTRRARWHLGRTHVMEHRDQINRYNDAFLANLVPTMRPKRNRRGRRYDVPYLEVVLDAGARRRGHRRRRRRPRLVVDDLRVVVLGVVAVHRRARHPLGDPLLEHADRAPHLSPRPARRLVDRCRPSLPIAVASDPRRRLARRR